MSDRGAMRPRAPRKLRNPPARGELRTVVDETIALFHRLRWVAEQIYGDAGRSTARRGILRGLVRYGAQTVPALARARSVSRQHVQAVVDALVLAGHAELIANPRHARSKLVRATKLGERLVEQMDAIDDGVLSRVRGGLTVRDLAITGQTLRALRLSLEQRARWQDAVPALRLD